ncbi:uncharacterized protein E5676_scaffold282G00250 [Cucumis melo var. makuwa]|uniref:Uncharacterized protein n=1 Tax=Cucumis melo var. makuwa TaxID=1194695 RepID=A0A5A7UPM3_CUCMM|nr:uncharacterized protein E6C27_scaffold221G001070 [Cucumis melo var. makuwa]TYJ95724.1 uncharacterized protein E5676_scaffold282G00250 [Cucumis melo var. makuwa]
MLFFPTPKKFSTACTTKKAKVAESNPTKEKLKSLIAWTEINFICKNLILDGLTNELYDYYDTMSIAKENDFKNIIRHKTKEFSLESLITHLRIKEKARRRDQKEEVNAIPRKQSTLVLKLDLKPKGNKMKRGPNKQKNSKNPNLEANQVEEELVAMIIEINVIESLKVGG